MVASTPYRTHGVNDFFARQAVGIGDFALPGLAAAECAAFGEKVGTGSAVYGAVYASATEQRCVGGIDNGIDGERGDIGLYGVDCLHD